MWPVAPVGVRDQRHRRRQHKPAPEEDEGDAIDAVEDFRYEMPDGSIGTLCVSCDRYTARCGGI